MIHYYLCYFTGRLWTDSVFVWTCILFIQNTGVVILWYTIKKNKKEREQEWMYHRSCRNWLAPPSSIPYWVFIIFPIDLFWFISSVSVFQLFFTLHCVSCVCHVSLKYCCCCCCWLPFSMSSLCETGTPASCCWESRSCCIYDVRYSC